MNCNLPLTRLISCLITASILTVIGANVPAQDTGAGAPGHDLIKALTEGKVDLGLRLRYEYVDDDGTAENADALTNRTVLGYTTGTFQGISARLLVQDVRGIVNDYNDATGRNPGKARFAVVADPEETDFLEAYFAYAGPAATTFKLGRQIITYRDAPLHRFMGTVLWRQNFQNHDAFTLENKSLPNTILRYAYTWNVNRIFTDEAVISSRANFDSNSHLINLQYGGFKYGTVEAFAYLLDFNNAVTTSSATYGVRFSGGYPASERVKVLYALEYAKQDDYADNPLSIDEDYFLGELGGSFKISSAIDPVTVKFNYELLSGNGAAGFNTPLATGHAFQGWADRFLTTPADGIEDIYITVAGKLLGIGLLAVYHDLSSDHDNYDYGTEFDIQAVKPLNKNFTLGLKYSDYNADGNALNSARNGAIARDVSKFWAWLEFKY
jgi:hypothetical protein